MKKTTMMDSARKMSDDVFKTGRNFWLAGLGAVAVAEEETRGAFDRLVEKGETFEKGDNYVLGKAYDRVASETRGFGKKIEDGFQETVSSVLHRAGVPTRDEILALIDRVEKLTKKVEAR